MMSRSPAWLPRLPGLAFVALLALALAPPPVGAVPYGPFNRPEDDWLVTETEHFTFYFTEATPDTLNYLLQLAEPTLARLAAFYGEQPPGKITVTIVGYTSYANGFADSQRNRITIFPSPPNFHARSRVEWLKNVFTHELSHILSLERAARFSDRVPLILGTGVARTGGSQSLARLPLYGRSYPHWFVEGVAQFDTELMGRDAFDENRAAYQRAAWEDGLFYSLDKLAFFGGESWYNTGFAFLRYLEARFGPGTVHRLFKAAGDSYYYVFDGLFEDVLGIPLSTLEREFRAQVAADYRRHVAAMSEGLYDGKPVAFEDEDEGEEQPYWALTPDQRDDLRDNYKATPLHAQGDTLYFRAGKMILAGTVDPKDRTIRDTQAVSQGYDLGPNGKAGFFVLRDPIGGPSIWPRPYWPEFASTSLFLVQPPDDNGDGGDSRELVRESHLVDIDVCESRAEMAAVYNDGDGSLRLVLYPIEGFGTPHAKVRTDRGRFVLDEQVFDEVREPRYAPDCERLYFSRRQAGSHDIFYYDFALQRAVPFANEAAFELYPQPTEYGVYFISSRDGTMSVYYRENGSPEVRRVTQALTAHHYPVPIGSGLVFARLYGTGFLMHYQRADWLPNEPAAQLKSFVPEAPPVFSKELPKHDSYNPWSSRDILAPGFVPMLDLEYDTGRSYGSSLRAQAGVEMYIEDQLDQHSLLLRGLVGNRSSIWAGYTNSMTPLTLKLRGGFTDIRSLYTFVPSSREARYDHVTDYRWGFFYAAVGGPLSLYHVLELQAERIYDLGTTVGARDRDYDVWDPRLARDSLGLQLRYLGIDRSDPTFRERDVNKQGYREYQVDVAFANERVHPVFAEANDDVRAGNSPYVRAELRHTEYIELPAFNEGWYDHTLQVDVRLGYISRDITFLPFFGGGRLFSLTSPEINTSVGFSGYDSFALAGETLVNVGFTYRFPLARRLAWDWGPLYLEDVYAQVFTSWGNIWGFDDDGERQIPFVDRAGNGRYVVGDVGIDLRLWSFFQEVEANVGTTVRAAYRLIPFTQCTDANVADDPGCLSQNGERGFIFYFLLGGGF